jgi:hypothetical protein
MMRSSTTMRLLRRTSGFDCQGTSYWSEKLCGRLWRAMCRMSRKPRVVIMPTSAPLRSITMLVATVVPWKTMSTSPGAIPAMSQISSTPLTTPIDWSSGVEDTLCTIDRLAAAVIGLLEDDVRERPADVDTHSDHGTPPSCGRAAAHSSRSFEPR